MAKPSYDELWTRTRAAESQLEETTATLKHTAAEYERLREENQRLKEQVTAPTPPSQQLLEDALFLCWLVYHRALQNCWAKKQMGLFIPKLKAAVGTERAEELERSFLKGTYEQSAPTP